MKTEKEILARLETTKKNLRETKARFVKYDNHEDMDAISIYGQEVKTLEWVLGPN